MGKALRVFLSKYILYFIFNLSYRREKILRNFATGNRDKKIANLNRRLGVVNDTLSDDSEEEVPVYKYQEVIKKIEVSSYRKYNVENK